jgi:hypothetical protein
MTARTATGAAPTATKNATPVATEDIVRAIVRVT